MPTERPYGSWPSPISAARIVAASTAVGEVHVGTDDVWWSELRPHEAGRAVVVRHRPGGELVDVVPPGFSARTRVHEYGGGAWWLHDDALFFANWSDQRLYRIDADDAPRPLTPEPSVPAGARYADGRVTPDGRWVICVRELHGGGGEPVNELVAVDAHDGGEPRVLVSGPDFVSFPRINEDGSRLCWTQWDHPDMPWDATQLWIADLHSTTAAIEATSHHRVAGGGRESICQPAWAPDGSLRFVSDRSDWWNLYSIPGDDLTGTDPSARHLAPIEAEIGTPQWVFDQSRHTLLADGRVLCAYSTGGVDRLGVVDAEGTGITSLDLPFTSLSSLRAFGEGAVAVAAGPTTEPTVVALDVGERSVGWVALRSGRELGIDPRLFSVPESIDVPTEDGGVTHALLYRPTNPDAAGPMGDRPPLVVLGHGGPTSAARPQLNLTIQYWTSRGLAVADVNYRGSTGYGRPYRDALREQWGVVDVDDCVAVARWLVERGEVAEGRLAIRGGSAGGFTVLSALERYDLFDAGASLYGVTDLEALARDTHKFESRYLDGLIGPYPQARQVYLDRSPISHVDQLDRPLIVFQGLEDEVVPPAQAEVLVEALRAKGIPVAYLAFEGEQHGFRQAGTMERVLEAELYFYAQVLGFELAEAVEPVTIENLGRR